VRALQYAMVVLLNGVLIIALVAGIERLANIEPASARPADRTAIVPQPTPSGSSIGDRLRSLDDQLGAVSR
jgi:hypothetical protein